MTEGRSELIQLSIHSKVPYRWAAGRYWSRLFKSMRDHKRLIANQCPKCGHLHLPPSVVCGRCHIRLGEDFIELSGRGKVVSYTKAVEPIYDPGLGVVRDNPHPVAMILLDEGAYIHHRLEEQNLDRLSRGLAVEAVWRDQGRTGGVSDILYFRITGGRE